MKRIAANLVVAVVLAAGALACLAPGQDDSTAEASGAESIGAVGTGPLDALSRRFGRVRSRMRDRGYVEEIGFARMFALEGEGIAVPIDLVNGRCTTFVALAGGTVRDLSLSIFDSDGREVATDSVAGEGGLAHVCPRQPHDEAPLSAHYFVVSASEGSGAVVAGAFVSAPTEGEGFDGIFESVLAPTVPFRDVEEQLARSRSLLRSRGMLPTVEPVLDAVAEGDGVRSSVVLEEGRCYVAVARGDSALSDIDLLLFDPAGAEVGRDQASDAEPTLEHCPAEGGRFVFEARAFEGAGAVGLLVVGGPAPETDADEEATPELVAEPRAVEQDPAEALAHLTQALEVRGYGSPVFVVRDGNIGPGEVRTHEVRPGGGCAVITGAAGATEMDLDLYLADESGTPIDRDSGVQATALVRACPDDAGVLRVTVKSYGRHGSYALAVLRAPPNIEDVRGLRMEEASAGLIARGYRAQGRQEVTLTRGETMERAIVVRPGVCLAVAAAGDRDVEDIDLLLHAADGSLVAATTGPEPYAAVRRCADEEPETLELSLVLYRGAGSVQLMQLEGEP